MGQNSALVPVADSPNSRCLIDKDAGDDVWRTWCATAQEILKCYFFQIEQRF